MHTYREQPRHSDRRRTEAQDARAGVPSLLHLQRSAGNRAVTALLTDSRPPVLQRMKIVGESDSLDLTTLDQTTLQTMKDFMSRRGQRLAEFTIGGVTYRPARGDLDKVDKALAALIGARSPGSPKRERSPDPDDVTVRKRSRRSDGDETTGAGPSGSTATVEGTVTPDLLAWMESKTSQKSGYGRYTGPAKVRQVKKDDISMACWNWATEALSEEAEPSHGNFWNVLHGEVSTASWYTSLADAVKQQIAGLTADLQRDGLKINPFRPQAEIKSGTRPGDQKIANAAGHLRTGAELFLTVHGLTVVPEADAAAWVVCQYRRSEGAAVPEHWWIELRGTHGPVIIQTVPDVELEIGGPDLRWHSDTSARGRDAEAVEYSSIRIPIKALKGRHVDILRQGMEAELAKG